MPMPPKSTRSTSARKRTMTAEHKAAIKAGRIQNKAVGDYLEALESSKGRPGRRRTPESIDARLAKIAEQLETADAVTRLNLLQEREDLTAERAAMEKKVDLEALEKAFIEHAAAYGERKGISYSVWRQAGVSPAVLKAAGITRSRRTA